MNTNSLNLPDPTAVIDQVQLMKYAVGWTCVGVFIVTALAVCLAIFFPKIIPDAALRQRLYYSLVVEVVLICVGLFFGIVKIDPSGDREQVRNEAEMASTALRSANKSLEAAIGMINEEFLPVESGVEPAAAEDYGLVPH
jgi:high-affinity Fe2+/Pb2+ permease